ncbi:hypothetical protein SK128_007416, partial [Halocaridina rubra]
YEMKLSVLCGLILWARYSQCLSIDFWDMFRSYLGVDQSDVKERKCIENTGAGINSLGTAREMHLEESAFDNPVISDTIWKTSYGPSLKENIHAKEYAELKKAEDHFREKSRLFRSSPVPVHDRKNDTSYKRTNGNSTRNHIRMKRETGITKKHNSQNMTNMVVLITTLTEALASKHIVILHDNQPKTEEIITLFQNVNDRNTMVILDITSLTTMDFEGINDYIKSLSVHILVFEDLSAVMKFIQSLSPHRYAPVHLLIFCMSDNLSAKPILAHPELNRSPFVTLLEIMYIKDKGIPKYSLKMYNNFQENQSVVTVGTFDFDYDLSFQELFPERFIQFHGHLFHLASWDDDFPYMLEPKEDLGVRGMCVSMLTEIAQRLNFSFQAYHLPPDSQWGSFVDGEWRGMIGEVVRGEK